MSAYQCDSCEREFPGGTRGTTFLVVPDGRTFHFCSGACLRAHVNTDVSSKGEWTWMPLAFALTFMAGAAFEAVVAHFTH